MAVQARFSEALHDPKARSNRKVNTSQNFAPLGGAARELPDGLIVRGGGLRGGNAHGFGDHRVVMAAAVAGLAAPGGVEVDTAEAIAVTFPDFCERMRALGARIDMEETG